MPAVQKYSSLHLINIVQSNWVKYTAAACWCFKWQLFLIYEGERSWHGVRWPHASFCRPVLLICLEMRLCTLVGKFSEVSALELCYHLEYQTVWKSSFCFPCSMWLASSFIPSSLISVFWEAACFRGKSTGLIYWVMLPFFVILNFSFSEYGCSFFQITLLDVKTSCDLWNSFYFM